MVHNYSTDGTYEILKDYQKKYLNITIIQEKCTGKGDRSLLTTQKETSFHS